MAPCAASSQIPERSERDAAKRVDTPSSGRACPTGRLCTGLLRSEFDVAPEPATEALYQQIQLNPDTV